MCVCVCVLQWYDIAPLHISAVHPPDIFLVTSGLPTCSWSTLTPPSFVVLSLSPSIVRREKVNTCVLAWQCVCVCVCVCACVCYCTHIQCSHSLLSDDAETILLWTKRF